MDDVLLGVAVPGHVAAASGWCAPEAPAADHPADCRSLVACTCDRCKLVVDMMASGTVEESHG